MDQSKELSRPAGGHGATANGDPEPPSAPQRVQRLSLTRLIQRLDRPEAENLPSDTIPTGFRSLDTVLGGGMRQRDLIVLGGEVGSGKSALALSIAIRAASAGETVVFFSGEMDEDRIFERALAIEGRTQVDQIRSASLSEETRSVMGAVALKLQELPLHIHPIVGRQFDEALASAWQYHPRLIVVDCLQLLPAPTGKLTQEEDGASALRALKALALERQGNKFLSPPIPLTQQIRGFTEGFRL